MNQELSEQINNVKSVLEARLSTLEDKRSILRSVELKALYEQIKTLPDENKAAYGQAVNELRQQLSQLVAESESSAQALSAIDVSAPFAINSTKDRRPGLLPANSGSEHPIMSEQAKILDIFKGMGFSVVESREIDDDWHMFGALNFPEGHPARDHYDTFMTTQTDVNGKQWIAPAHTSTMQNRILEHYKPDLENGSPIAVVIPGRVFRNEDVDARHEHTFYQMEGVYVGENVSIGNLIATLKVFLESYYEAEIKVKTQPFYFPFTEPSLEFSMSCPFCNQAGCRVCSYSGWIEMLGCGMIHPNVLKFAGIDASKYQGFAWGCGIERFIMLKHGIEDIRLFESGRLDFLRQFSLGGGGEQ